MTLRERIYNCSVPEPNTGCWLWTAAVRNGYGRMTVRRATHKTAAHRVAYEVFVGPIPHGMTLDHLCRVRCCVNPEHLEPVTMRENIRRGTSPVAQNIHGAMREGYCQNGHSWDDPTNVRITGRRRDCRACQREQQRKFRAKT